MRPSKRHRLEKRERELRWRPRRRAAPVVAENLFREQKPAIAMLAGVAVAAAGAMIWTIVALATGAPFHVLTIAIGAAAGLSVGHFGRVVDRRYARISAYLTVIACVVGEMLVAYALQLKIWLLYTRNSLLLLAVFVLAGAVTAHLCTFAWLSRDQKQALWNARHARAAERAGPPR